jgi:hypothetical protein
MAIELKPKSPFDRSTTLHDDFELRAKWQPISLPDVPAVPGYLFWTPKLGGILRLFGEFRPEHVKSGLVGATAGWPADKVALLHCRPTNWGSGQMDVQAGILLTGAHLAKADEEAVKEISVELTHLGEWMQGSLLVKDNDELLEPKDLAGAKLSAHLHFVLDNPSADVNLNFGMGLSTSRHDMHLKSHATFALWYRDRKWSVDEAWRHQTMFRQLLSLMVGDRVTPTRCTAQVEAEVSSSFFSSLFLGHQFEPKKDAIFDGQFDLTYSDLVDAFPQMLNRWFGAYDSLSRAMRHFFDVADEESVPVDHFFLKSVLAYETFAKAVLPQGGDVNLAREIDKDLERVRETTRKFFEGRFRTRVSRVMVGLRSDFVHGSNNFPEVLKDRTELGNLGQLAVYLFRFRVLEYLGASVQLLKAKMRTLLGGDTP